MGWIYLYPSLNFNSVAVKFWEWISNFVSHLAGHVISYPCWDLSQSMLVKATPRQFCAKMSQVFCMEMPLFTVPCPRVVCPKWCEDTYVCGWYIVHMFVYITISFSLAIFVSSHRDLGYSAYYHESATCLYFMNAAVTSHILWLYHIRFVDSYEFLLISLRVTSMMMPKMPTK